MPKMDGGGGRGEREEAERSIKLEKEEDVQ